MITNSFELKIDFERGTSDPARVFRSMASLIEATGRFDFDLVSAIACTIQTDLLLEDVQAGSLRTILSRALKAVDGEALKSGDWKQVIGSYLDRGRRRLIERLDAQPDVESKGQLLSIQNDLHVLAQETDIIFIPCYEPITLERLMKNIQNIGNAMAFLGEKDSALYILQGCDVTIPKGIEISPDLRREILVKESITSISEAILKVKKPDFIGRTMWQFKFSDRIIEAKIEDEPWVSDFQSREREVRPGDSLKVTLESTFDYGFSGDVVDAHYTVKEVHEIMKSERFNQLEF